MVGGQQEHADPCPGHSFKMPPGQRGPPTGRRADEDGQPRVWPPPFPTHSSHLLWPSQAPLAQVLWSRVVGAWLVCRELIRLAMKAGSPIRLGTAGSGCPCVTGWVSRVPGPRGPQPLDTIVAGMGPGQPRRRAGEGSFPRGAVWQGYVHFQTTAVGEGQAPA